MTEITNSSQTDNIRTKIILIENEEKHIEDTIAKCSEQIAKLREDTAMQAAQIDNLEKDIIKLEEIVDTYRGKIDSNCDFINKHDEKFGCKITDIQHDVAILKTKIALNATSAIDAMIYPSSVSENNTAVTTTTTTTTNTNDTAVQQSAATAKTSNTTVAPIDLSTAGKVGKKSIDSLMDTFMKVGAILISIASFVAGWIKV